MATEELSVRAEAGDSDMLMCQTSEMINKYLARHVTFRVR